MRNETQPRRFDPLDPTSPENVASDRAVDGERRELTHDFRFIAADELVALENFARYLHGRDADRCRDDRHMLEGFRGSPEALEALRTLLTAQSTRRRAELEAANRRVAELREMQKRR